MIRDLYDSLIAPKMQDTRENWDNGSDDVCYVNRDPEAQERAGGQAKDRQKKEDEMSDIERRHGNHPRTAPKYARRKFPTKTPITRRSSATETAFNIAGTTRCAALRRVLSWESRNQNPQTTRIRRPHGQAAGI